MATSCHFGKLEAPAGFTLGDLLAQVLADPDMPLKRRQDTVSAIRGMADALRLPPAAVPACPVELRALLKNFTPAMASLSSARWRNIRSLVLAALIHAGIAKVPDHYRERPTPAWAGLLMLLKGSDRYVLGHFARYCTVDGITPEQVDEQVLSGFGDDQRERSLKPDPERAYRDTIKAWNRAADAQPAWPQVRFAVPDRRRRYCVAWADFAPSLQADVQSWLDRLAGSDALDGDDDFRPLRATSITTRKKQLFGYLSTLVLEGIDISELRTLADAVAPGRARIALSHFWKQAGNKASLHGAQIAGLVKSIACHYARLGDDELKQLGRLVKKITPVHTGMTERNKARLRPLDDPKRVTDLLMLPVRLKQEVVAAGAPTLTLARKLQTAVAIELLIMVSPRIRNLASLKIGVHLITDRPGRMTLAIPGQEVKNGQSLEAILTPQTVQLIDLYIRKYRPLLAQAGSPFLFPGQAAEVSKTCEGMRAPIVRCIRQRCGLDFRPHTFRHAVGRILLARNPAAHAMVQQILGHKRIQTTLDYYADMQNTAATAHWDGLVEMMRAEVHAPPQKARKVA